MSFNISDDLATRMAFHYGPLFDNRYEDIYRLVGQSRGGDPLARQQLDRMKAELAEDLDSRGLLRDQLSVEERFEYDREKSRRTLGEGYNCPTGECRRDRVCAEVRPGDNIAPYSREHIERNACNRCPRTPPQPVYVEKLAPRGYGPTSELAYYMDSEGNQWAPDSWFTASVLDFHGDPLLRDTDNQTYRVIWTMSGEMGWQCRYESGKLDDSSRYMGTYDYGPTPHVLRAIGNKASFGYIENIHNDMDVVPHMQNGYYVPNLTEVY
ncbi:MAG: hypothetical protein ACK5LJ_00910 [Paracoccus sp. (in: a-proteobacteria)]